MKSCKYRRKGIAKPKKPRHTIESRFEATVRERLRVQEIRLAYKSLQMALNIPMEGRPRYLHILQSAIAYIRYLEDKLGLRMTERPASETATINAECIC